MPALPEILLCAAAASLLWVSAGLALGRFLIAERALAWGFAPTLGWAVFNALALPIATLTSSTRLAVALIATASLAMAAVAVRRHQPRPAVDTPAIPWWGWALAILLALIPAIAILPKSVSGGIALTAQMYDHSKIAIVDDIVRLGLPPGNPFFGEAGTYLAYYYLWHFGAAFLAKLLGVSGWEADIALTWFTAFAALALMMGLAVHIGGRRMAALWVALLSFSLSLRPVLSALLGPSAYDRLIPAESGLQNWILQGSWSPQHLAGATCLVLAVFLLTRLAQGRAALLCPALALVVAAGFESSAWIGGIAFAMVAPAAALVVLLRAKPAERRIFLVRGAIAAGLSLVLALPFIRDDAAATLARHAGAPLSFHPYAVLSPAIPEPLRRLLDLPAYWLVLLVIEFPALYLLGGVALARAVFRPRAAPGQTLVTVLAVTALACCGITWLLTSTIMNNDLGWRAILPGLLILTVFAAVGATRWLTRPLSLAGVAALVLLALGLPDGVMLAIANARGVRTDQAGIFAQSPELWAAVRRHSGPRERVANNPDFVGDMTGSPINISWALFAGRRSCFAGLYLALPFVPLPADRIEALAALFGRVFAGAASPEEVDSLATDDDCRLIVITPEDGAWTHDEFAGNPAYRLVDENPARWRLYRPTDTVAPLP